MSELWRKSLERLQRDFELAEKDGGRLACLTIKTRQPSSVLELQSNLLFLDDISGLARRGIHGFEGRYLFYFGSGESAYERLATKASSVLLSLAPKPIQQKLWFGDMESNPDSSFWTTILFELACRRIPPLIATQHVWVGGCSTVELSIYPQWCKLPRASGTPELPNPPNHWFATLGDLLRASIEAIDIILSFSEHVSEEPETEKPKAIDPGDSIPPMSSGEWVNQREAADRDDVSVTSLATMRSPGQWRSWDKLMGIDKSGRKWRKESENSKTIWYYAPSLLGNQVSPINPKMAES